MSMDPRQRTFEALVNAYSDDLYRYAYWLCHNSTLAEDLVQEAFVRAWKALDRLEDEKAAKAWLFTILRRENARYFERKHNNELSLDDIDLGRITAPDQGLNRTEYFVLRQALVALPVEYREPLILQTIGGYSCDEIASMLEVSAGAIMTRLSRARQKLRDIMGDHNSSNREFYEEV